MADSPESGARVDDAALDALQNELLDTFFNTICSLAMICTPDGTICRANDAAAAALGCEGGIPPHTPLADLSDPLAAQLKPICNDAVETQRLQRGDVHWQPAGANAAQSWDARCYPVRLDTGAQRLGVILFRPSTQAGIHDAMAAGEQRLRTALDAVADGVWEWHLPTDTFERTEKWYELTGYARGELESHEAQHGSILDLEDASRMIRAMNAHLEGHAPRYECEFRMRRKTGELRWILGRGRVVARDTEGRPVRVVGTDTDITARKHAERALYESEQRLKLALDAVSDGVWDYRIPDDEFIRSAQWYRLTGYAPLELAQLETTPGAIIHPDDLAGLNEAFRAHLAGETSSYRAEFRIRHKSGAWRWLLGRGRVVAWDEDGRPVRMVGTDTDITDAKRSEQALRDSERRYRTLARCFPDGALFLLDRDQRYVIADGTEFAKVGLVADSLIGKRCRDVFPPEVADVVEHHLVGTYERGEATYYEVTFAGNLYSNVCVPVHGPDGSTIEAMVITQNITEHKRAETELKRALTELSFHIDNTPLAVIQWGADGCVTAWSRRAETLFGWQAEEVLGKSWMAWKFVHEDDIERVAAVTGALVEGRDDRNVSFNRNYTRNGEVLHCEWYNSALRDSDGKLVSMLSLVLDITPRLQLEEQLRQSQKMEAIGQLAGGVAHDFNNILTAILGHTELLRSDAQATGAFADLLNDGLDEIERAGQRAAALTRQLLVFSRKQLTQPRLLNVNSVINEVEKMLQRLLPEHVALQITRGADLPQVRADVSHLEQVVMNLVVNARDALPAGGRIVIETAQTTLTDQHVAQHPDARPGLHVVLSVSDNGVGMDTDTRARIFEPFFTTKPPGEGTGLGLATVHGIVRQAHGHITVQSNPGHGTRFDVYLPAAPSETQAPGAACSAGARPSGRETVLLCEDDETVRRLTRQTLVQQGYTVLTAANAREALQIADELDHPPALLITDVVMPGLNGAELTEALRARAGNVRVLYISGHSEEAIAQLGLKVSDMEFIQKPFSTSDLLRRVRSLLDQPTG